MPGLINIIEGYHYIYNYKDEKEEEALFTIHLDKCPSTDHKRGESQRLCQDTHRPGTAGTPLRPPSLPPPTPPTPTAW